MKNNHKKIVAMILIGAFFVLLVLAFFMGMKTKETYISTEKHGATMDALVCNGVSIQQAFFNSEQADNQKYLIKSIFKNGRLDSINTIYQASYQSEILAEGELSRQHADYNIFMGDVGLDLQLFTPNFSRFEKTNIINLFINKASISKRMAKLLFLSEDDVKTVVSGSEEQVRKLYQGKGFSCE